MQHVASHFVTSVCSSVLDLLVIYWTLVLIFAPKRLSLWPNNQFGFSEYITTFCTPNLNWNRAVIRMICCVRCVEKWVNFIVSSVVWRWTDWKMLFITYRIEFYVWVHFWTKFPVRPFHSLKIVENRISIPLLLCISLIAKCSIHLGLGMVS